MPSTTSSAPVRLSIPQAAFDLYDEYVHGRCDRRGFLDRASKLSLGGLTAAALLETLSPNYARAQQVPPEDARIVATLVEYPSPEGHGTMKGLLAHPATGAGPWPAVLVVHENRGLNPYVADVVRRLAVEGFLAFGPDALTPLGGYPGNDEAGRELQRQLDRTKVNADFVAAARWLDTHRQSTGKVGVVGFCFGGGMSNYLAVTLPDVIDAAVPFYGAQPDNALVPQLRAPVLLHFAEKDERVNAGWPAFEAALREHGKAFEAHFYPGTNHGFHNDSTPRYDPAAAALAWERTLAWFRRYLLP